VAKPKQEDTDTKRIDILFVYLGATPANFEHRGTFSLVLDRRWPVV